MADTTGLRKQHILQRIIKVHLFIIYTHTPHTPPHHIYFKQTSAKLEHIILIPTTIGKMANKRVSNASIQNIKWVNIKRVLWEQQSPNKISNMKTEISRAVSPELTTFNAILNNNSAGCAIRGNGKATKQTPQKTTPLHNRCLPNGPNGNSK